MEDIQLHYRWYWNFDVGYYKYRLYGEKGQLSDKIHDVDISLLPQLICQYLKEFHDMDIGIHDTISEINRQLKQKYKLGCYCFNLDSRLKVINIGSDEIEIINE